MPTPLSSLDRAAAADGREADSREVLDLAAGLRMVVTRLARRLRQQAEAGVTPSMLSALHTIDHLGPITLGDLATAEQVRPPTMTEIVARLEQARLVVRASEPSDRRVIRVSATPEGRRLLERIRSRKTAYLATRLRKLPPDRRRALREALPTLGELLEENP